MIHAFSFASTPELIFGPGKVKQLPSQIKKFGSHILLVTGAKSFSNEFGPEILSILENNSISVEQYTIDHEPSPLMIDTAVERFHSSIPHAVIAIGGGSVLDAGKAISAMLPLNENVKAYLEGVGTKNHSGIKIPFIAVPTTAGTGSEATKNAVLSEIGPTGYKRSLRHNNFVPNIALLDPQLLLSCPQHTRASSGMDAFTQLLESYLSTSANPMTDSLALEGLRRISNALFRYYASPEIDVCTDMALAAYLSGITLANAGLGTIHGFASSVGSYFDIPHGVVCSSLMYPVNLLTVKRLRKTGENASALKKYAVAGSLFTSDENRSESYYVDLLLDKIQSLKHEMKIPSLGEYGVLQNQIDKVVSVTENKNNPVSLSRDELAEGLRMAI